MENQNSTSRNSTPLDTSLLLIRVIVGVIFAAHGSQKLFGWFGGPGMEGTIKFMQSMDLSVPMIYLVAIGECFGGLGLIIGFLSRFSAAADIVIMVGAIIKVHGQNGFFQGRDPNHFGFEYNLALIGLLLPILIFGPGRFSLGRFLPLPKSAESDRPIAVLE